MRPISNSHSQDNLSVTIAGDGDYIFTVAGPNPQIPMISVSKTIIHGVHYYLVTLYTVKPLYS